jgi:hypothetical protein
MIGLVALLLAAAVLGKWVFALSAIPYLLRLRDRNLSLVAFYAYALAVALSTGEVSIYTAEGAKVAILTLTSTFLLLDEVLRGIQTDRRSLYISALLAVSAVNDYTLIAALIGATLHAAYLRFGRAAYILAGWFQAAGLLLYLGRERLTSPAAQSLVLIGLALLLLLLAERKDVEFTEVRLIEED